MDPELYVFPKIESPALKVAASTALFAILAGAVRMLPLARLWTAIAADGFDWLIILAGYSVFIYASYQAWCATREKNRAEDPQHQVALRLLDTGFYSRVRHPMYAMFMLANAGLGLALNSVYGLVFSMLSFLLFQLNGIFEERASLIPQFGDSYLEYMRRVPARYFTRPQAVLVLMVLALNLAGVFLR